MAKSTNPTPQGPKKSLFNIEEKMKKQIKYIAFTDERTQTDIVSEALVDYIAKWEKKNGPIPVR